MHFESVSYSYPRSRRAVLENFTWEVPSRRSVLLGPNGAGKSTVLALAAGALAPRSGTVRTSAGISSSSKDRAAYVRMIGWMPQDIRPVARLTVREQVAYAGWLKGMSRRSAWDASGTALAQVDLSSEGDRRTSMLSGGQLRRAGLAEALVSSPSTLLLDEPTAGLDPSQRARFRTVLVNLPEECTVVVSTHQVDDLADLFDDVSVLAGGALRFTGTTTEFLHAAPADGRPDEGARRAEDAYRHLLPETYA